MLVAYCLCILVMACVKSTKNISSADFVELTPFALQTTTTSQT